MKIFVTVGTTPFEKLIREASLIDSAEIILQVAESNFQSQNCKIIKFTKNINDYYMWADVVICHAGAGTIYKLLEMNKLIIVVPNLDRIDQHQNEIANFVELNNYGIIVRDVKTLNEGLLKINTFKKNKYEKEEFFLIKKIIDLIKC